ncbi:MAG: ATP-binding cassette domain-containing protein [Planctomycetes bacterium]|nr:ATP-binding cassette domain-containing protein [Planctomycetota bacterium]
MTLNAKLVLRRGALDLDVEFEVGAGETLALVGPNGAGKSTCLHAIAGLVPLSAGQVRLAGDVFDEPSRGVRVPAEARGAGVVFQEHRLFPHLTALDNTAYGLRCRGAARSAARASARAWLERFGLGAVAEALPRALSGGQAQRVALARALAAGPRLLLLDEPLAAVDATARLELRRELRAHMASFAGPRILVAHDALDAFAFADRIAVLEHGRIVQSGTVAEICSRPRSRYVADLVGTNLLRGVVEGGVLRLPGGGALVVAGSASGDVVATVHPRAIALFRQRPDGSPRNVWSAPITFVEAAGDRMRVQLGGAVPLVAEVTPAAVAELGLARGGDVWVAIKATEIALDPI